MKALALILAILCSNALADDGDFSKQYKAADYHLNLIYQSYIHKPKLTASQRTKLQRAQGDWLRFLDNDCKFQASGTEGGTAQRMIYTICLTDRTNDRIKQIEYYNYCEEGDLSCPAF